MNLSLAWRTETEGSGGEQDTLEAMIRIAMMEDIVVAAAGNCGDPDGLQGYCDGVVNRVMAPAIYPGVIAVAATGGDDTKSSFSTAVDHVGIAAPGGGIRSTWNQSSG